jgi:AcrR family transcriptional regulator
MLGGMAVRAERARRLPPDERREALIAATLPLVLRHGPGVTTRQIAEAADVAEGTIFRVFADKEALIQAVVERAMDPSATLRELAGVDRGLELRVRLAAVVEIVQNRLTGIFTLIDALGLHGPPRDDDRHRPMNDQFREAVVDIIGDDRTRLRVPAAELATALRLLVFAATHPRLHDGNALTPAQIVSILLDGLLDRSGGN